MILCPVCGYDPNPIEKPVSYAELHHQRVLNIFNKNLRNTWWVSQGREVCKWLKEQGISPKRLIDIGCGDARFLLGIIEYWPNVEYVGVDKIWEHIEMNRESFPEFQWIHGDFCSQELAEFDTAFIMGTLNPKILPEENQKRLFDKTISLNPKYIVCLFDLNTSGTLPDSYIPTYNKTAAFYIPKDMQGPNQKDVVWLYER